MKSSQRALERLSRVDYFLYPQYSQNVRKKLKKPSKSEKLQSKLERQTFRNGHMSSSSFCYYIAFHVSCGMDSIRGR